MILDQYASCKYCSHREIETDIIVKEERENKNYKYEYQTNVNNIISSKGSRFADAIFEPFSLQRTKKIDALIKIVWESVVPNRPDLKVARKENRRNEKFHHKRNPMFKELTYIQTVVDIDYK